ncbi:MAG: hypothetical protein MPK62_07800, partial [Alphaproteobacteria bacterium]|nr:hypothetical protein [Alphaproteobacteria bacterium]
EPDPTGKPPVTVDAPREIYRDEVATVTVNRVGDGQDELRLAVVLEGEAVHGLNEDYMVEGLGSLGFSPHSLTIAANQKDASFTIRPLPALGLEDPRDIKVCVMRGEVSETPGAELCGPDVSIIKTITLLGTNRVVGTGF